MRGQCKFGYVVRFSSRRRHTRYWRDWISDVCSSDLRSSTLSRPNSLGRARPNFPGHRAPTSRLKPPAHDYLLLRVEAHGVLAVRVEVAEEGVFPAGEGEEGHGGGDAYVDADHADLAARTVLAGGLAAGGEDRRGVAEGAVVDRSEE